MSIWFEASPHALTISLVITSCMPTREANTANGHKENIWCQGNAGHEIDEKIDGRKNAISIPTRNAHLLICSPKFCMASGKQMKCRKIMCTQHWTKWVCVMGSPMKRMISQRERRQLFDPLSRDYGHDDHCDERVAWRWRGTGQRNGQNVGCENVTPTLLNTFLLVFTQNPLSARMRWHKNSFSHKKV